MIRTDTGQPLSNEAHDAMRSSFERAFGGSAGPRFHVGQLKYESVIPLSADMLRRTHADYGYQLTVYVDGQSSNHCLNLPLKNVSARIAQIGSAWYLIQQMPGDYRFHCGG